VAIALLATTLALAPALAEAQRGGRGGGGGMRGGGGGGGGGVRSAGVSSISRGSGGMSGGGGRASSRPAGGAAASDRMANRGGDRANTGNINSGNRVNTGDINRGNINTGNTYNRNVNVDVNDRRYDYDDHYHPVARGVAVGAAAAVTAAAIGSTMYSLPPACSPYAYGGYSYYSCGGTYYETRYEGDTVVYVVVEPPG